MKFRDSTHTIPIPGEGVERAPRFEDPMLRPVVVLSQAAVMITTAVALEIGLFFSEKLGGFSVPEENKVTFVSAGFLLSFIPTLFIVPVVGFWNSTDWTLRWYQPYVALSQGYAPADETLLLDYTVMNKIYILWRSFTHKHFLLCISGATTLLALFMQPLAASIFKIHLTDTIQPLDGVVTSIRRIDLDPEVDSLNAFLAAAGFTEAAAFHGLPDPPFIQGGWAIAEFEYPRIYGTNGQVLVNTTGIRTEVTCGAPSRSTVDQVSENLFRITAISFDKNCPRTIEFDPTTRDLQFGVQPVVNCNNQTLSTFQPVFFWFFQRDKDGRPEARSVFCEPKLSIYNVQAFVNLADQSLANVEIIGEFQADNNITGGTLAGKVYNGVTFDSDAAFPGSVNGSLDLIKARGAAIKSGLPGAIFRLASIGGIEDQQKVFASATGFLELTTKVYTQHLAISAKSVYFTPERSFPPSRIQRPIPRLILTSSPTHFLAIILSVVGTIGIYVHLRHRQSRKKLYLTTAPGTIASSLALTARGGFGELILPYDDIKTMERKFSGLEFTMDGKTGAIIARKKGKHGIGGGHGHGGERDSATVSLLAKGNLSERSSFDGEQRPNELELVEAARESWMSVSTAAAIHTPLPPPPGAAPPHPGQTPLVLKNPYDNPPATI